MLRNSLFILHFLPISNYPPVLNLLKLIDTRIINLFVVSTYKFEMGKLNPAIKYLDWSYASSKKLFLYLNYLTYNFFTLISLLIHRPSKILLFETYSIWPAVVYCKFYNNVQIMIHYHEYISFKEKQSSSVYLKYLYKIESKFLLNAIWISHTNSDRLALFQLMHPKLTKNQLKILPNYPLLEWFKLTTPEKKGSLIYVGALGMDTMYLKEINEWLNQQNGQFKLDIYSNNIDSKALNYLHSNDSKYIIIKSAINYYDLPNILIHYKIGLVLYKGHIPNYIYNLPNKVTEYLHAGLDVWYPKSLTTTTQWANEKSMSIGSLDLPDFFNLKSEKFNKSEHSAETALKPLIQLLTND